MADFRRSASRVWWSSIPQEPPPGPSSSPSSSHRSQDSGFSDRSQSPPPHRNPLELSLSTEPPPPPHTSTPKGKVGGEQLVKRASLWRPDGLCSADPQEKAAEPVRHWLTELSVAVEPECTTALQSKSVATALGRQVAVMAAAATHTLTALQQRTRLISAEYAKLCRQLERGVVEHVGPLLQSLLGHMCDFLRQHVEGRVDADHETLAALTVACDRLRLNVGGAEDLHLQHLSEEVAALGRSFTTIVDSVLSRQVMVLVGILEEPSCDMELRSALCTLTALGLDGPRLSSLVAACGGVRALLTICLESSSSSVRGAALRALAAVCCTGDSIRQLEQVGGVEILSDVLSDEERPEPEVSEAVAVLAQITAPWVEDNQGVQGLDEQLPVLVQSLTRLCDATTSEETLLLAAAALANLTFMEPRAVWPLLACRSAGCLLQAVRRRGPCASVFLQEQAATLLANMSAVPESRQSLAAQRAVVALLCFLQVRHSPLQMVPEISAAERLQHKSAIALSRLCSDPSVAQQVVELQGVARLVRLCKDERERNHSDGVLVACLAALRKIAANCGNKVVEELDALELVEPRLVDSFLIYSSRQESYV